VIQPYRGVTPKAPASVFVADTARVIGDVELGEDVSVWFGAVLRGDVGPIRVGRGSNVQDGTIAHVNRGGTPTIIGEHVTIGHAARLHGCTIASHCLVGIAAVVLDGAEIGEESVIAAGALVAPGTKIPPRSMVMGVPARVRREVTADDLDLIRRSALGYIALKADYLAAAVPPRG
jgi:carbonic anhydrase/acetyltransferase-like protein (isoleucine patch superfamily)